MIDKNNKKPFDFSLSSLQNLDASQQDIRVLMEKLLDEVSKAMHAETASVALLDEKDNSLRLIAVRGDVNKINKDVASSKEKGVQGRAANDKITHIMKDDNQNPDSFPMWHGMQSEIAVPIFANSQVIGVIDVESSRIDAYKPGDEHIMETFAQQAAIAIRLDKLNKIEEAIRFEKELLSREICFVLMPFSDPFNKYYEVIIAPAIESCGIRSERADSLFGPANIVFDIWEGIKRARILIAELTGRNPNVMYELGLAHAIEKPVILLTQDINDVPFDLRSLRCIVYNTKEPEWANKLRDEITKYITVLLQEGKKKRFRHLRKK